MTTVYDVAKQCLSTCDLEEKLLLTKQGAQAWREGQLVIQAPSEQPQIVDAGHPEHPILVMPKDLAKRRFNTLKGRGALIHSIAHIEFNAINLAWDAVYRFQEMPQQFYGDWIRVADEEAYHFSLMRDHLNSMGYDYGDFNAHNGLWEMAKQTAHDIMTRMALVPRVLEARGLDVTPDIMGRLKASGDDRAVEILEIILRDEIGHVAVGTRWFHYCCEQRGLEPEETFFSLFNQYMKGQPKGSLHREARLKAGFTENELSKLEAMSV